MEHRGFFHTRTRKEGLSVSFGELALKLGMLLVFFGVMIYVGFYCRKHSTDVNGFVLGGRNVGPWLTAFAYGTSYFSAVIFVGYAGQFGWKFGIASTWVGIGNALIGSLLAWVILGRRTRVMTQHLSSATMPDFFEKRFSATSLKIAASIIIFIFMIPYTASLYNGLSRLFRMAFGIDYSVCVIVMAVLTAVYVIVGGYMATAVNDFIQGIIMLFGIVAVIAAVLGNNGGFIASLNGLAAAQVGLHSHSHSGIGNRGGKLCGGVGGTGRHHHYICHILWTDGLCGGDIGYDLPVGYFSQSAAVILGCAEASGQ